MTYSYIKSVFPNFETSKVYDEKNYNSITLKNTVENNTSDSFLSQFILPINQKESNTKVNNIKTESDNIKKEGIVQNSKSNILSFNENEMLSLIEENYNTLNKQNNIHYQEMFTNDNKNINNESECTSHLNHVLECIKCKEMFSKQLNLEYEKLKNEEIIEVVSYIVFGIFVLLILDNISKK